MVVRSIGKKMALFALPAFAALSVAPSAFSQDEPTEPADVAPPVEAPKPKAKIPRTKRGERIAKPPLADQQKNEIPQNESMLLPDWPVPQWDLFLSPVLGMSYTKSGVANGSSFQIEGGIWGGLVGIPLAAGNPGLFVSPSAGYAIGKTVRKQKGFDVETGTYHRRWVGMDLPVLVKFFKETIGFEFGKITGKLDPARQNIVLRSDSALLLLPYVSGHFTHTSTALYGSSFDKKLLTIRDNWLHLRLSANLLSAFFDVGPGMEYQKVMFDMPSGETDSLSSSATYLKAVTGAELLPKVGVEGQARYTISSDPIKVVSGSLRLPTADLSTSGPSLGGPEDHFSVSFFAGYKFNKYMSVGYQYNLNVFNVSERDGAIRDSQESQGFGLHVSGAF